MQPDKLRMYKHPTPSIMIFKNNFSLYMLSVFSKENVMRVFAKDLKEKRNPRSSKVSI